VFSTKSPAPVVITVYDITGKTIKQIAHDSAVSGQQTVTWRFENETMLNGVYFYTIRSKEQQINGKLLIMK
jgi:hypothetical protein